MRTFTLVRDTIRRVLPEEVFWRLQTVCYPLFLRRFALGRTFFRTRSFLKRSAQWTPAERESWQLARLREIVAYAYEHVPGYYQLYKEAGVQPDAIRTLDNIALLPFVDKVVMRENSADFISRAIPHEKRTYVTTTGSTGTPFGFYTTAAEETIELAFIEHAFSLGGFRLGDRMAVFRGATLPGDRLWVRRNGKLRNGLLLASGKISAESYPEIRRQILAFRPPFISGYPSVLITISDLVQEAGDTDRFRSVATILGTSEELADWQVTRIKRAFPGAVILGHYGLTERCIMAMQCAERGHYHVLPEYGVTELIDPNGTHREDEGGELVGTSFTRRATPFIRYRTGDLSCGGGDTCPDCNRTVMTLRSIQGRVQDYLITAAGERVTLTLVAAIHSQVFSNVYQFQFYQESKGDVILRYVPKPSFTEADARLMESELQKKLGDGITIELRSVDSIKRSRRGKLRVLEQKLDTGCLGNPDAG